MVCARQSLQKAIFTTLLGRVESQNLPKLTKVSGRVLQGQGLLFLLYILPTRRITATNTEIFTFETADQKRDYKLSSSLGSFRFTY